MDKRSPPYSAIIKAYSKCGFKGFALYVYCGEYAWTYAKAEVSRGGHALAWPANDHFSEYDWSCVKGYSVIVDHTGGIEKQQLHKFLLYLLQQGAIGVVLNDKEGCIYYG